MKENKLTNNMENDKLVNDIMDRLQKISLQEFKNSQVIELDNYFFKNKDFLKKFKKSIGGREHHVYLGGLAEHTLNVVEITKDLCYRYNCIHKEIAILAAKLHDIGKIYEYDENFETTLRGEMEGHIVIGMSMIENAFCSIDNLYNDDFKCRLRGCVVQHHGEVKYGSPKPPNTQEAYIVHHADYLDCMMYKISDIKSDFSIGSWTNFDEKIKRKLYI